MKKKVIVLFFVALCSVAAALFLYHDPNFRSTSFGRFCRFMLGTSFAVQNMEDLESEILRQGPDHLRDWSLTMAQKYLSDKSSFSSKRVQWVRGDVIFSTSETLPWMKTKWSHAQFGEFPTPSIKLNKFGVPKYVMYEWYLKGVAIALENTDVADDLSFTWETKEVAKGIYVYAVEK
jgi:hypothetical protein